MRKYLLQVLGRRASVPLGLGGVVRPGPADGEAALALAAQFRPDVVLMDLRMPRLDGVISALQAGALGYLTKDAGAAEIEQALRRVASGHAALECT